METKEVVQAEIFHRDYNLDKRHNLDVVPAERAVYGIFAIIHDKPVHCRFVGETDNLHDSIQKHFETEPNESLRKFMQGPWIQMLVYHPLPESSHEQRLKLMEEWTKIHNPNCDERGEYPN